LDKVEEKLKEADIILTERKTHLRELKKDRDQALKYRDIQGSLNSNKATYINLQIKQKQINREDIEKKIKEQENFIKKVQIKINELKKDIEGRKSHIGNVNKEIEDKGEKGQIALHKDIESIKEELIKNSSRLDVCNNEISKIGSRKVQLKKDYEDINKKINSLNGDLGKYEKDKKLYQDNEKKQNLELDKIKKKYGLNDLDNLDKTIDGLQEELFKLKEEKSRLNIENYNKDSKLKDIEEKIKSFSGLDVKNLRKNFKNITDDLSKLVNEEGFLSNSLSKNRKKLVELNEELSKLNIRNSSIKQTTLDSLAVKKIKNSNIKGIYNVVSELGSVNKKYSLALEVAAGPRLKSLVIEDDSVGEKCIKYLKDNKLGIVTFLPLNKIKGRSGGRFPRDKGVHGLAIDLVRFDSKFKNIFSYVFGDTVVVDNVQTARKLGVGSYRMVTLEGDLMETSGAMIGGYRKRTFGSFKEKGLDEDINKLEKEVSKLRNDIDVLDKRKVNVENEVSELKRNKAELEVEIIKIDKSFSGKDVLKEKNEIVKSLNELNSKLKKINSDIEKQEKQVEDIKKKKESYRNISELNKLDSEKSKTKESLLSINSEIKNLNVQIDSILNPEKGKIDQILKNQDKELEEFKKEVEQLKINLRGKQDVLKDKEKKEKQFYSDYKGLFNKRNKFNDEMQKKETQLVREEERIRTFEGKLNNISLDKAKLVAEIEGLDKEFEPFKDEKLKKGVNIDEIKFEMQRNERSLNNMGNVNLRALEVYEELEKDYGKLLEKREKLSLEKEDVVFMINEIEGKKTDLFMKTFKVLQGKFGEAFTSLSTKGHEAFLELENKENPLEGGLDIKVKLARNKYMDIKGLSGGEKTLAALSFIFSIQEFSPASFYLFDEVDAALDKHNSDKLTKLIAKYSKNAQYIVISHNDSIISEADQVYGVSMQQGVSKIVSLKI
ncbi:hypothetical protein K8R47_00135, partial [archaeon]|nr:hypothetical protein [archaeon]